MRIDRTSANSHVCQMFNRVPLLSRLIGHTGNWDQMIQCFVSMQGVKQVTRNAVRDVIYLVDKGRR